LGVARIYIYDSLVVVGQQTYDYLFNLYFTLLRLTINDYARENAQCYLVMFPISDSRVFCNLKKPFDKDLIVNQYKQNTTGI